MSGSTIEQTFLANSQTNSAPINRAEFEKEVYMTIEEAVHELSKREQDKDLDKKIEQFFEEKQKPEIYFKGKNSSIFRQLATCNYENSRFLIISDSLELKPIFFEYLKDKFVSVNELKKYFIKMPFHFGFGKNNDHIIEYKNIADINESNGKHFDSLKTFWGEDVVDFHRNILKNKYNQLNTENFFDASEWLETCGKTAENYYKFYLALFTRNTVLFENFMLEDEKEREFVEKIFLPSFRFVRDFFGVRPIIVALEPTDIEGNIFWHSYSPDVLDLVKLKMSQ